MSQTLLNVYNEKRNFDITEEPRGALSSKATKDLRYVIQLHEATRTHYDLRLEWLGVMKSWAVTRGPSFDPSDKRLAVRTEDHPLAYNDFEGVIPSKQYGAGPVMIWDKGIWTPEEDPELMESKGRLNFSLTGVRMKGQWHLVRMKDEKRENWLLIKGRDQFALNKERNAAYFKKENMSITSGRRMDQIRGARSAIKIANKQISPKLSKSFNSKNIQGTTLPRRDPLRKLLETYDKPELAILINQQPVGEDWVHEIKFDGYRIMAFKNAHQVILRTRGGNDWTHKFETLVEAIKKLKVKTAVFDLEACVLDKHGNTDFGALQTALSEGKSDSMIGWIFDLLYLNGQDLTRRTLIQRKSSLAKILKGIKPPIYYSVHFESEPELLARACKMGAEGLISKKKSSLYFGRRTHDWVKSKCKLEQEFVIGGFMPAKDNGQAIGALLLGYYKNKKLIYVGKVGTGFSRKLAREIYQLLIPLKTDNSFFATNVEQGLRTYTFVKPQKLCEITFMAWTTDGHLRHASFKGLREDKKPIGVRIETPIILNKKKSDKVIFQEVTLTHPNRVVYQNKNITKAEVADYYSKIAPLMLPFIENRLISLLRCTDGVNEKCFFQRNPMQGMGDAVQVNSVTHKGKQHEYLFINSIRGLLQLIQMGTVEVHTWQSNLENIGKPNQIIFDLDPDESVPFEAVKLAAEDIRNRLKKNGLISFPRLSGGKGIHVIAPILPEHNWDKVKAFTKEFSERMARAASSVYVANMSKKQRRGKIFIDYFRNDFSATSIAPFSLRAREAAAIAWTVTWRDLKNYKTGQDIILENIDDKLIRKAKKVSKDYFNLKQRLEF